MSLKMSFLKGLDALAGAMAVRMLPTPPSKNMRQVGFKKILVIRPGGIGDAVLLIPCLQAIRTQFPQAGITVLAELRNSGVFALCPEIDCLLLYDRPPDLFKALAGSYDMVIDTEQWHRLSSVAARLINAPVSIGFATNERSRLFTSGIVYSHDAYEIDSFFNLLEPLGIYPRSVAERFLVIPPGTAATASKMLAKLCGRRFVTVFPGASIPERRWGAGKFRLVAERLSSCGIAVVVIGGKEDWEAGEGIVEGDAGLNLAGQTSLAETAAIIDRSVFLISGDSGVLHIAVGLGKPAVSLFGPGRVNKWGPRGEHHIVINRELPCSPCTTFGTTPPCPFDAKCMKEIGVDEVFNSAAALLAATEVFPSSC